MEIIVTSQKNGYLWGMGEECDWESIQGTSGKLETAYFSV